MVVANPGAMPPSIEFVPFGEKRYWRSTFDTPSRDAANTRPLRFDYEKDFGCIDRSDDGMHAASDGTNNEQHGR